MKILHICPSDLSDATILPWEIQKSHFSTVLRISGYLCYLRRKQTATVVMLLSCLLTVI